MKFIWISLSVILGLLMFVLVKQHFIWSVPYLIVHLSIISLLIHSNQLPITFPRVLIPLIFIAMQLIYSLLLFSSIQDMGLDDENFEKQIKLNLIRIGVLLVEYPLILEFMKKPKFNRY